jgi:hypothetical protein
MANIEILNNRLFFPLPLRAPRAGSSQERRTLSPSFFYKFFFFLAVCEHTPSGFVLSQSIERKVMEEGA